MEGRRERGQSDRARDRENWGQRKMGDSKEGRERGMGSKGKWREKQREARQEQRKRPLNKRRLIYHSGRH